MRLREHTGQDKKIALHVRMVASSKQPKENEEESATMAALTVEVTVFLTSAWSWTLRIVDTTRLMRC